MSDVSGVAKAHVTELQEKLKEEKYLGSEWDLHRQLLRCAHATTNGGAGDIRILSENVGMLTATYVQDRIRHPAVCPVTPLITTDADGHKVMPWEAKRSPAGTFLSYDFKNKRLMTGGLVSVILALAILFAAFRWLSSSVSGSIKESVNAAIRVQIQKTLATAPYEAAPGGGDSAN